MYICTQAYVRTLIEQRLDVLIPISHQPRELVQDIITDTNNSFPEFSSCVRKRIRTYLKSYRRSKKMKDGPSGLLQNGVKVCVCIYMVCAYIYMVCVHIYMVCASKWCVCI